MTGAPAWDVVVVGGTNSDHLVRAESLPAPGATVQGDEYLESPGGKGANQAVACARLGARVAFVSRVGPEPRGDASIEALRIAGVEVSLVARDESAPTGVALIAVDASGEKRIVTAPGANHRVSIAEVARAAPLLHQGRVVLLQLGIAVDATGAGDAFAAALAVMLAEGRRLEEAGPIASAAAALTTRKLGAQPALPRRGDVEALLLAIGLPVPPRRAAAR